MAQTSIEWTAKVWNPVTGCNKVSQGCKNCYAEKMHKRLKGMGQEKYQRNFLDGAFPHEPSLLYPLQFKKPTTFFVNSMSDLFHEMVPAEYIDQVFDVMDLCRQHTFQILTKRSLRLNQYMNDPRHEMKYKVGVWPLRNVHIGVSVENQAAANERIPDLLNTPAAIRWLSMEPLLERVNLKLITNHDIENLDWIVVGGESGPKRRPFDANWAREIREFCWDFDVPFFMKQIDKKQPIPEDLMIREFPKFKQL